MTAQPQPKPTLRDFADKLERLTADLDQLFDTLSREFERSKDKFDNYQKATQWVVQLAFCSDR